MNNVLNNLKHNAGNKTAAVRSLASAARTGRPEGRALNRSVLKRHVPSRRRKRKISAVAIFLRSKQKSAASFKQAAPNFLVIPENVNFFEGRFYGEDITA